MKISCCKNYVLLSVFFCTHSSISFFALCSISVIHIYKCAPTLPLRACTHTHNHWEENQANHPHEFLLKWYYWNGSRCFPMSITAHYATCDKNISFPSQASLVNMLGGWSEFNLRCQLGPEEFNRYLRLIRLLLLDTLCSSAFLQRCTDSLTLFVYRPQFPNLQPRPPRKCHKHIFSFNFVDNVKFIRKDAERWRAAAAA